MLQPRSVLVGGLVLLGCSCYVASSFACSAYLSRDSSFISRTGRSRIHQRLKTSTCLKDTDGSEKSEYVRQKAQRNSQNRRQHHRSTSNHNWQQRPRHRNGNIKNNYRNRGQNGELFRSETGSLNKLLANAMSSPLEILAILSTSELCKASLTSMAGGGKLNSINFATAFNRMSRSLQQNQDQRFELLSDPKFALFLCCASEAFVGMDYKQPLSSLADGLHQDSERKVSFKFREISSILWALAKLGFVPPPLALPINYSEGVKDEIVQLCYQVRSQVLEGSRTKQRQLWIPSMSKLSAKLMDSMSYAVGRTVDVTTFRQPRDLTISLWSMVKAQRFHQESMDRIMVVAADHVRAMGTHEIWLGLWAYATGRVYDSFALDKFVIELSKRFDDDSKILKDCMQQQDISVPSWALATIYSRRFATDCNRDPELDVRVVRLLRHYVSGLADKRTADKFKSQELTNSVWAMATVGFGSTASDKDQRNEYVFLASDDPVGDASLVENIAASVAQSAVSRLDKWREQELNNLAWSFARLGQSDHKELFRAIGSEFASRRRRFDGQDIGTVLWAFAMLNFWEEDVMRLVASRLQFDMGSVYKPQEVSSMCWGLATAGIMPKVLDAFDRSFLTSGELSKRQEEAKTDPFVDVFNCAANELIGRPHEFKTQEIVNVLYAFSKAGIRDPALFKSVAEHLVGPVSQMVPEGEVHCGRGWDDFSSQGTANALWAFAKQAQVASLDDNGNGVAGRMLVYHATGLDLGEPLLKRFFYSVADACITLHDRCSTLSDCDIANVLWAHATAGLKNTRLFNVAGQELCRRLKEITRHERFKTDFIGRELATMIWSFATMDHRSVKVFEALESACINLCSDSRGDITPQSVARIFKRKELSNILWSCTVLGVYRRDLLQLILRGLLGEGDERNPEYMTRVHGDGGLMSDTAMNLMWWQMVMDLDEPGSDLCLPPGFPGEWNTKGFYRRNDFDGSATSEDEDFLRLKPSTLQAEVSAAFDRIGVKHVQEHTITRSELVENYGVRLGDSVPDLATVDVAIPDRMIAIEVDGPTHFLRNLDTFEPSAKVEESSEEDAYEKEGRREFIFRWSADVCAYHGSSAMKDRFMRNLGWTTKNVPFYEWYKLGGNEAKEEEYCRKILES